MQFLIREVNEDQGQQIYLDREVEAAAITIGSAADQLIQLRGASVGRQHAVLTSKDGKLSIATTRKKITVQVNGKSVTQALLATGDEIVIETHSLKIVAAPSGFDAACELTVDVQVQQRAFESAYVTDLSGTLLGKRAPAYLISLVVLLIAFAWPFSAYMTRDSGATNMGATTASANKDAAGDVLWSSGPLHEVHQIEVGDNCAACHVNAFEQVRDAACLNCHQGTPNHYSADVKEHLGLAGTECQNCHKEHNEPEALVVSADSLCVDCHNAAMVSAPGAAETAAVVGFDPTTHPEFKLNYLLPKASEKGTGVVIDWHRERIAFGSAQKEISNLKFPHDVHLDVDKVQTADTGAAMSCSGCHTLKSDNEHFEDITMEKHCAACHDLSFDMEQPDRQLPHGNPAAVVQTIEEHFVRVYTDPAYTAASESGKRRLPGRGKGSGSCTGSAFQCGNERAIQESNIQFTQRGCVTCHEVSDNNSNDVFARWQVLPVKITSDWYVGGLFDHKSHLTTRGKTEVEVCSSCHEAAQSHVSSDVMIPGMDNCLECHGDIAAQQKVIVNCVSCHAYHLPGYVDPLTLSLQQAEGP